MPIMCLNIIVDLDDNIHDDWPLSCLAFKYSSLFFFIVCYYDFINKKEDMDHSNQYNAAKTTMYSGAENSRSACSDWHF